jgi:hypothetical protein
MRTRKFKDVLKAIVAHRGTALTNEYLDSRADLAQFINDRLRHAWYFAFWRDLLIYEKRTFRPKYVPETPYAEGREVWWLIDGVPTYFRSMAADNIGVTPGTDETKWKAVDDITEDDVPDYEFEARIALDPTAQDSDGGSAIGEKILAICNVDPRKALSGTVKYGFLMDGSNVWARGEALPLTPWMVFLPPCPVFTTEAWNQQSASKDDLVYSLDKGECYRSTADSNTDTPGEGSNWELIKFPAVLFDFVTRTAYCDFVRADGLTGNEAEAIRRKVNDVESSADDRMNEDAMLHAETM